MTFVIAQAVPEQAEDISRVLQTSILTLCVDDHKNDPVVCERWVASKTPAFILEMIADPRNRFLVALSGAQIASVGAVRDDGHILLNYVHPAFRFHGASRMMIAALEGQAQACGCTRVTLSSTGVARRFYVAQGYREVEPPRPGLYCPIIIPMEKLLR